MQQSCRSGITNGRRRRYDWVTVVEPETQLPFAGAADTPAARLPAAGRSAGDCRFHFCRQREGVMPKRSLNLELNTLKSRKPVAIAIRAMYWVVSHSSWPA